MRVGLAVSILLVAASLAGCSSNSSEVSTTPTSRESSAPALGNRTIAPNVVLPHTATLHLALAPQLNRTAPNATEPIAMPLAPASASQGILFNTTLRANGTITAASTSLWIRIAQSNLQAGSGTDPGCTVALTVYVHHNGTDFGYNAGCGSLGLGVVPPGDHLVEFSSAPGAFGTGSPVQPGDDVKLYFTVYLSGPGLGPSAYLLTGSMERDSGVRLSGLAEPVA